MKTIRLLTGLLILLLPPAGPAGADAPPAGDLREMVAAFKEDFRGPFQAIRWFCPDGSVIPAKERCTEPGGIQHGLPKDTVQALRDRHHLFLGQVLAGTPFAGFLDRANGYSRLQQYQIEKFLQAADNGWILRKARYYRGAFQGEDEEEWGSGFFRFLLGEEHFWVEKFFLLRQAARDVPHWGGHSDLWAEIRADSKRLAELAPAFSDLRVKLHGQPDRDDTEQVLRFLERQRSGMSEEAVGLAEKLLADLRAIHESGPLAALKDFEGKLPAGSPIRPLLQKLLEEGVANGEEAQSRQLRLLSEIVWQCRLELANTLWPVRRMILLDLSLTAERALFQGGGLWQAETLGELFEKFRLLARAAAGAGYLELWEWREAQTQLQPFVGGRATLAGLKAAAGACRRLLDWAAATVGAEYRDTVQLFGAFEPLAYGFIDDRIRSSVLLPLGETAQRIETSLALLEKGTGRMSAFGGEAVAHGANAGLAVGPLRIVDSIDAGRVFDPDAIYVLRRAPADLTPVAGLLTAGDGNLVSHLRLLARNLGIPSSTFPPLSLDAFRPYEGQAVFYAVSPGGKVLLKPADSMTAEEKALLAERSGAKEKMEIPVLDLDLSRTAILGLQEVRAADSGRICGPKAANLGQLKHLFPDKVTEGLVIPFGIFRSHMAQPMPGESVTFWQYLQRTFAERQTSDGPEKADASILQRLQHLRQAIRKMELQPEFTAELAKGFAAGFGSSIGESGVFIRSDTNMEDLKDFTGAGLNLTVFNVVGREAVLQAIRDVWASPYSERSYLWRQRFMSNPLEVYPSILILPSVPVDRSGVLLTTGIESGKAEDCTVAFSRGVGGAVEGQAAESYLLQADGSHLLLQPARELSYRILPWSGGVAQVRTNLHERILSEEDLRRLASLAGALREKLPQAGGSGPYDVELGFAGERLWLFQVRPFVENRWAQASAYLRKLDDASEPGRIVEGDLPLAALSEDK